MKIFHKAKDGGPASNVTGYWLIEAKWLFSIAILKIGAGSREAYHSHAFNAISWLFWGRIHEDTKDSNLVLHTPSIVPIITTRDNIHRVIGLTKNSWVLTFRGPWKKYWKEVLPDGQTHLLGNGREIIAKW